MCVAGLPVALVPLWQVTQPDVVVAWLNVAGFQAVAWWQLSQGADLVIWAVGLAVAMLPL